MKPIRMTMLSRSLALFALLAACVNTQSLAAQSTARDSLVKTLTVAKARSDSLSALSNPSLRQFCSSGFAGFGYMKNGACVWYAPLFRRDSIDIAASLARALVLKLDTVRVTKTDTVTKTVTVTTTDTLRIHDTVFVKPPPAPVTVATLTTTLASRTLLPGQTSMAHAVAKDSAGNILVRAVTWKSTNTTAAAVSDSGLVTAISPGSALISATVDAKTSSATITVSAPPPPPDTIVPPPPPPPTDLTVKLPALMTTTVASTPSTGRTLSVPSTGNLQAVFDSSKFGDRIMLPCGATYTGNFVLSAKAAGTGWVTVQSTCVLPPEGTRTSPGQAFAKITSAAPLPTISTVGAAARWRFIGVEVVTTTPAMTNGLIQLGCAGAECERDTLSQPKDIIFDRSYIHGATASDFRRCLGFNGARMAVVDSWVSDCHSTFDAQAVSGFNGPGPFKIVNNYLEGAAENIAFGGSDPAIVGLIPSDIEIRRNHIVKPLAWSTSAWSVKNLIEFKIGRRVLIEGNVIENSWPSGQNGFAFVLWSVNQQATCKWCVTEHVTIQNNIIRNVAGGWSMVATGANGMPQYLAQPMNHVAIKNNVLIGMSGAYGRIFEISDTIRTLTIEHNTAFSPSNSSFLWGGSLPLPNHIVRNNLVGGGQYQIFTTYGQGQIAWDHAGGVGSVFAGNVVALFSGGTMIPGNYGPGSFADLGLVGGATAPLNPLATLDDLSFQTWSGYAKKGTDGTDPGANMAAVKAATAGVAQTASTARIRIQKP